MNSGRMTFRFDTDKDKDEHKPKVEERRPSRGLGTAEEYAVDLRQEVKSPLHTWSHDPDIDFRSTREAPPEVSYAYYSGVIDPRQQDWDMQDVRGTRTVHRDTRKTDDVRKNRELRDIEDERKNRDIREIWDERNSKDIRDIRDERNSKEIRDKLDRDVRDDFAIDNGDESKEGYGGQGVYGSYGGSYHTRRPSYWWKLALSIAGAIGTGLLLGYAALSLFYGGNVEDTRGGTLATNTNIAGEQSTGASDPAGVGTSGLPLAENGASGGDSIPVQVAAQSYYLLQYGVFSTPAGAAQAQQELLEAGLAAGLDPADGNRVYAGVSPDREQAKLLSSGLKNQGIELYVRELALPSTEQVVFSGNAEAVNSYFSISGKLLSELSSQSASLLSIGQTDTAANIAAVSDLHMQWTEAAKALEVGLSPEERIICAALEKSISQGISALAEYNKNKAQALLWEVQESMLSFLTNQKKLLSAMM